MKLTLSVRSFQVPALRALRPDRRACFGATSRATRVTSDANALSWSTMVLMVFFSSENFRPSRRRDLARQSRRADAWSLRDVADLGGQIARIEFTLSVEVFPGAGDARHGA